MASASKQLTVAMFGHPPGSRHMRLICAVCPIRLLARIDSQNDQCDLMPVRAFRIRVQQPEVMGKMEFIIRSYRGSIGRLIGHRRIWIWLVAQGNAGGLKGAAASRPRTLPPLERDG